MQYVLENEPGRAVVRYYFTCAEAVIDLCRISGIRRAVLANEEGVVWQGVYVEFVKQGFERGAGSARFVLKPRLGDVVRGCDGVLVTMESRADIREMMNDTACTMEVEERNRPFFTAIRDALDGCVDRREAWDAYEFGVLCGVDAMVDRRLTEKEIA
jgi:hypothetical protein